MIRKILTSSLIALIGLGGFFVSIEKQSSGNAITSYSIGWVPSIFAADQANKDTVSEKWNTMIDYLNMAMGVITAICAPAIILASWLMSPDWTSGDLFGLRGVMHSLWVTVSNILYVIYAILLIVIALATMFNQEKYSYKALLPKLALGIIMVPFTWWFVQWTISLASVVTASVITIPQDTLAKLNISDEWMTKPRIPKELEFNSNTNSGYIQKKIADCKENEDSCLSVAKFTQNAGWQWAPLVSYGYGIFKFEKIQDISSTTDVISAAIQLVHRGIIGVLMFFVFGILVIALIFILLVRAIKLWMYAIFSPLFTLHFVLGKDILGEKMNDFSLKEFIGLAFVPAVVGITLSFGLVIVSALMTGQKWIQWDKCSGTTESGTKCIILFGIPENQILAKKVDKGKNAEGQTMNATQTTVTIWGISWTFEWPASNNKNDIEIFGALDAAGNSLWTIIIDIIALVFIWAAFMAAKWVSKAVDAAVKPFEEIGNKLGGLAKDLPKYTPLPFPGGSIAGMNKTITWLGQIPQYAADKRYEESTLGKIIRQNTGGSSSGDIARTKQVIESNTSSKNDIISEMRKYDAVQAQRDIIPTLTKEADSIKKLEDTIRNKYSGPEQTLMLELAKDWKNLDETGRLKLAALLWWAKSLDVNDAKIDKLKTIINDNKTKNTVSDSGNWVPGWTKAEIDGKQQNHIILSVWNITNQDTKVTLNNSATEIAKWIEGNVSLKWQFTKESLRTALSWIISDPKKLDEIIKAIKDEFFNK